LVNLKDEWSRKGATLSDKTVRKEFGLTQDEITAAIDAGQLQYRVSSIHGNPWLRLLRREVESLVNTTYNDQQHEQNRAKAELGRVNRKLKQLHTQVTALEAERDKLLAQLND
jgi:ABC-type phosphate transport system auxiliary subunit